MSGNQKQAPPVGAQSQPRYPQQSFPFYSRECDYSREQQSAPGGCPRAEIHVPPHSYVQQQQQPPNQTANQGPPLRGMAPTGPPTQASTPPNADIKVQQHVQQQQQQPALNMYTQRNPNYFQRPPQANQQPRIMPQRPNQQSIYTGQPAPMVPYHVVNMSAIPQYPNQYTNQRPAATYMPNLQFYSGPITYTQYPMQQQFYYNQPMPRQSPSQVAQVAQSMTHPPQQAAAMAPAPMQPTLQKKVNKKRSNAIAIIDPKTMRPIEDDESHPTSGESSARQSPQSAQPQISVKDMVQATFAKQVAQLANPESAALVPQPQGQLDDGLSVASPPAVVDANPHLHNLPPDGNSALPPQQSPAPFHQNPQHVHNRNEIVKPSKIQPTNDFVPANPLSNTAKETPVVSAISNSVEVTIPGKPKDRESPAKGRKPRESTTSSQKESAAHKDAAPKEQVTVAKEAPAPAVTQELKQPKEEKHHVRDAPVVQATAEAPAPKVIIKEPQQQQPQQQSQGAAPQQPQQPAVRDEKKPQLQQAKKADNSAVQAESANVSPPQTAVNQDNSGKSKQQAQRNKEPPKQQQQTGGPQAQGGGQYSKPPVAAATVPANQQAQQQQQQQSLPPPPVKSNKASKMKEINLKGANKEGTDMDAFSIDSINANAVHVASDSNSNTVEQPQQATPPPSAQSQQPPAEPPVSNEASVGGKKLDAPNDAPTIPVKPLSKKIDVCDIVKNTVPKPLSQPPFAQNKDETDRAAFANEKLVQAKNEVNAKTAISSDQPDIKPLTYKGNQWSPKNLDGDRVYDRDFLMTLRTYPNSKTKPENILSDVMAGDDRSRIGEIGRCTSGGRPDFAPSFGNPYLGKSQSTKLMTLPNRKSLQAKQSGNSKGSKSGIRVAISFREDVKLHESENAWKPARLNPSTERSEDDRKTEDLYKKVRGVLNKLTPQKFNTLINQIKTLAIDTPDRLQGVIDLVFEKAVDEPNFSVAYALMCRELALIQVPVSIGSKEFVNFRKLLVTRCQMEFEKNSSEECSRNERLKEIEECTDPEKKKDMLLILEEDDRRIRMKSVGNIRFIGELFKQNMLTVNIMNRCLANLIENEDEDRLECLCKLLTTIGKELESKNVNLGYIFEQMRNIVERKNGKVSSRVRFMLQDVIDLRRTGWVPRRADLKPQTIEQIQKEADNEHMTIQAMNSGPMTPRKEDRNSSSNADRKRPGGRNNMADDGWCMASGRGKTNIAFLVQSDKLKIQQPPVDEPFGSQNQFNWSRGSNVKPNKPSTPAGANMYAPLESQHNDIDNRQYSSRSKLGYNSSLDRGFKSYDGRNSRSGSQHRAQENSQRNVPAPSAPAPPAPAAVIPKPAPVPANEEENYSNEQLERLLSYVVDEFVFQNSTLEEAEAEFKTLLRPHMHVQYIPDVILAKMEKSKVARQQTGVMFAHFVHKQTLSLENYCLVIEKVFSIAEDLIVDIPQIWLAYAEVIAPAIMSEILSLNKFHKCAECLIQQGYAHHILAAIFKIVIVEKGPNFLQSLWNTSKLSFSNFMDSKLVEEFISKNHLEFLVGNGCPPVAGQSNLNYDQIYQKLHQFIQSGTPHDDIYSWITANVGERVKKDEFIRVLTTVFVESSVENKKLNESAFRVFYNGFHRYISSNDKAELQCLLAIQSLVNKWQYPQGLLLKLFNALYEDSILSHDSFIQWEKSDDLQESKGVAVKQLTSFFTQLKENESENESGESSEE